MKYRDYAIDQFAKIELLCQADADVDEIRQLAIRAYTYLGAFDQNRNKNMKINATIAQINPISDTDASVIVSVEGGQGTIELRGQKVLGANAVELSDLGAVCTGEPVTIEISKL